MAGKWTVRVALATAVAGLATWVAAADVGVPEALKGFRGMMEGSIVRKGEREFILKVEKITRTWKGNKAANPQAAVGKQVVCELWAKSRLYEQHRKTLAALKAGDRVSVEPFHLEPEHDHLSVVEELKKLEPPKAGTDPVPEGLRGFRGMLLGTIVAKGDGEFVLKVERVTKVWKHNKATNPQSAVGKKLAVDIWAKSRLAEQIRKTLAGLKVGDRVVAEAFHFEGNHLSVVEELRKED